MCSVGKVSVTFSITVKNYLEKSTGGRALLDNLKRDRVHHDGGSQATGAWYGLSVTLRDPSIDILWLCHLQHPGF